MGFVMQWLCVAAAMPVVFNLTLTLHTSLFFGFFQAYALPLRVRIRIKVRFRVHLLRLLRFYQAYYCILVIRYCYVTGGVIITVQISRSTGVSTSIATAKNKTFTIGNLGQTSHE